MSRSFMRDFEDPKRKIKELTGKKDWVYFAYATTIFFGVLILYGAGSAIGI